MQCYMDLFFLLRIIQRTMECLGCLHTSCRKKDIRDGFIHLLHSLKMTQIQYLILTLTVYLGIILLIALATIAIQFLLGNSYFSFAILILLNMALFLVAYYFECNIYGCYITPAKPNKSLYYKRSLVYGK